MNELLKGKIDTWVHYDSDLGPVMVFETNSGSDWVGRVKYLQFDIVDDENGNPQEWTDYTAFLQLKMGQIRSTTVVLQTGKKAKGAVMPINGPHTDKPAVDGYVYGHLDGQELGEFFILDKNLKEVELKRLVVTLHITSCK